MRPSMTEQQAHQLSVTISRFMARVYQWMALGVLTSGVVATYVATNEELLYFFLGSTTRFMILFVAQIAVVMALSAFLNKLSGLAATLLFFLYSALTGVTMASIFIVYQQGSIASVFFTSFFAFAGLSVFGHVTRRDLSPVGNFCMMGLWGLVGYAVVSLIFPSFGGEMGNMIYSLVGLIVFAGLTAYDTQVIKSYALMAQEDSQESRKLTILGALKLYLDFVNLFLFMLRIMGRRK